MQIVAMNQPPLTIRSATNDDKAAVLAFCVTTFTGGDYIANVWDAWLGDGSGTLLVGAQADQPIALAHIAIHESEAWFEGLRVAPRARGRGIGRRMIEASADQARRRGANVLRLLTNRANAAMMRLLPQLDFRHCFDAAWHTANAVCGSDQFATPADLDTLVAHASDGVWLGGMNGLYAAGWQWMTLTLARLHTHLKRDQIVHVADAGWAIVMPDGESDQPVIALAVGDVPRVLAALRSHPSAQQYGSIRALLPVGSTPSRHAISAGYTVGAQVFGVYEHTLR